MRVQLVVSVVVSLFISLACSAQIELKNDSLSLRFDGETAALVEVTTSDGIRLMGGRAAPVDIHVGGKWRFSHETPAGKLGALSMLKMDSHHIEVKNGLKVLTMNCAAPDWQAQILYEMPEQGPYFLRRAEWRYVGDAPTAVTCVRFNLPRACIDRAEDCAYTMPTLWPPEDIPLDRLREGRVQRAHSSGAVPAAVILHNRKRGLGLCATFFGADEQHSALAEEGRGFIDIRSEAYPQGPLRKGDTIRLGDQAVYLSQGTMRDAVRTTGHALRLAGFRLAEKPDWAYGASLYSLWLGGSVGSASRDLGGLENFQKYLLPRLHKLGFDAVWFNPTNPGGYAPTEYFDVDPRYGTLHALKDVCDDAHRRGMRIWLDLIPHGPKEHSPAGEKILKKGQAWVSREEDGSIKYWWGCLCCDYAHPGWQAYQADVATFFVKHCGVDGWRVDCAQGSPPNARPYDNLRPSQSGVYGALRLLEKVRKEMTAAKPDSALLGETGSILHLSQCDFIYDWSTQREAFHSLPGMAAEEWVALAKSWLERQQDALPEGAEFGLMRFLENHDQYKSVCRYGVGQERSLLSLCSLIPGLVFVFDEQDLGFGPHIERLFGIRKSFEEFQRGRAIYAETGCSAPSVFALTRVHNDKFSVAAINFSPDEQNADIQAPLERLAEVDKEALYSACEVYEGAELGERPLAQWRQLSLTIPAYGTRVVVFRRADEPKPQPVLAKKIEGPEHEIRKPLSLSQAGETVAAENGFYRIELLNGLIQSLADHTRQTLLQSMNIIEGTRKIWPGDRLDFAKSVKGEGSIRKEDGKAIVTFKGAMKRGAEATIPWEAHYTLDDSSEIGVEFALNAPRFDRPVRGQLGLELAFGHADEWAVNTLEGRLQDDFAVTHPLGDMFEGYRYWHRSGLLWEAALFPLDCEKPVVGARIGRTWLNVTLSPLLTGFENAYLRERSSGGREGLTLHLAWLDEKGRANLAQPIRAAFTLRVGGEPEKPAGTIAGENWTFRSEGSRYCFRNAHYDLAVCRGLGGGIARLAVPGGESVILSNEVYSDKGIYSARQNSVGKEVATSGSSKNDFEPDVFIGRTGEDLSLTFNSFLRLSYWSWANVASPRMQYEVSYGLNESPKIRVRCRARPMVSDSNLKAFVAQTLHISNVRRWSVDTAAGKASGEASSNEARGRVWESRNQPLPERGAMEIELLNGQKLRFSEINAPPNEVQNAFLLDGGRNTMVIFFAFFDLGPERYQPAWRTAEYTMEIVKP